MLVFGTQTDARRHGRNVITGQQQNPKEVVAESAFRRSGVGQRGNWEVPTGVMTGQS